MKSYDDRFSRSRRHLLLAGACVPTYAPRAGDAALGPDWPGGFYCPCHGSKFDLAGRVYKNVPAPDNLVIPPHQYVTDTRLLIGEDRG